MRWNGTRQQTHFLKEENLIKAFWEDSSESQGYRKGSK